MGERYTLLEELVLRPLATIQQAAKDRLTEEQRLYRKGQESAAAIVEQESHGRKVGKADYKRRMKLRQDDGLSPLPANWRGYDTPKQPAEPRSRIAPGPGAQNSELHRFAFDASLSPERRRKKVTRLVDRQNRELAKRRQQGRRAA